MSKTAEETKKEIIDRVLSREYGSWESIANDAYDEGYVQGQSASHPPAAPVSGEELPSIESAGAIAVSISEKAKPELTAQEQALFVAGFQECVKYLSATLPTREQEAKDKKSNKTVEICTRSIGGDVYVNYRREFGSDEANHLMKLVDDNIAKYGDESNYFYRIV